MVETVSILDCNTSVTSIPICTEKSRVTDIGPEGSLGPAMTIAAVDLVTSGYWERVDDGYRIPEVQQKKAATALPTTDLGRLP